MVIASLDGRIKVFELFSGILLNDFEGHKGPIFSLSLTKINHNHTVFDTNEEEDTESHMDNLVKIDDE